MKVLVYHSNSADYVRKIVKHLENYFEVTVNPNESCDLILSLQMGNYEQLINLKKQKQCPLVTYVWDCYAWIFQFGDRNEWVRYGNLIKESDLVIVPSSGQVKRLEQHWQISAEKTKIIPAYAQFFEYNNVEDHDYIYDPLRHIPDVHAGLVERVCMELKIPYKHGGRKMGSTGIGWDSFKDVVGKSSFLICPWYEASTGGMTLLEAYNIGKEVLICNSPYMGAKDYFGDRAFYFEPSYDGMKAGIQQVWDSRKSFPTTSLEDKQEFCKQFSLDNFCKNINNAISQFS